MNLRKNWYMTDVLSRTEREGLHILTLNAGIDVFSSDRDHTNIHIFPHVIYDEKDQCVSCAVDKFYQIVNRPFQIVSYKEVVETLKQEIKRLIEKDEHKLENKQWVNSTEEGGV